MLKLKAASLIFLSLLLAHESYGRPRKAKKKTKITRETTEVRYEDGSSESIEETQTTYVSDAEPQSSRTERSNKIVSLSGGYIAGAVGLHVTPNFIVGAKYQQPILTIAAGELPDHTSLITGYVEYFSGNTFYLTAGVGERKLEYESLSFLDRPGSAKSGRLRDVSYSDNGFELGIGNRWQWDYFTLGVQWLGVYTKFSDSDAELNFQGDADTLAEDRIRELNKRDDLTNPSLTSNIYLGVSF